LEEYSTGNVQRLKLAAALVHDPQLLLLDEPTNGLDPEGRLAMLQLIDDLISETGKSVILCTHLLPDVERLCQQIVVLHKGTVIRSGTMESLRAAVSNRYELTWQGASEGFLGGLRAAGVDVSVNSHPNKAVVVVPSDWSTTRFFALARAGDCVLTELKPDVEDLERLFFRVTEQESSRESAQHDGASRDSGEVAAGETAAAIEEASSGN